MQTILGANGIIEELARELRKTIPINTISRSKSAKVHPYDLL
jgi:hypothetical protein